jgi:hypothetical protein
MTILFASSTFWLTPEFVNIKKKRTRRLNDFRSAWNTLARVNDQKIGRGNFIFGFIAMNLLEYICRLCGSNSSALRDFSNGLTDIESNLSLKSQFSLIWYYDVSPSQLKDSLKSGDLDCRILI